MPTRQRWLAPILVVVVALTVSGGLLAQEFYRTGRGDGTASGASTAVSAPSSLPPRRQPGPATVELTPDAAAHPRGNEIRALLQDYFHAINRHDYQLWTTTVTGQWVRSKPEGAWREGYRSTRNGNILVYRIDATAGQRLRVLVAFTSTQNPADAPPSLPVGCIRWHLALPAVLVAGEWKLAKPTDTTPQRSRCTTA